MFFIPASWVTKPPPPPHTSASGSATMLPRRSWSSSIFMSLPLLILLLLIFALAFLFFALSSLNKTWDSFNIFLVLFAMILCGVFARQNDDESCTQFQQHAFTAAILAPSDAYVNLRITEEGGHVSHQWFGFSFYESEERMGNIYHTPPIRLQSPATDQVTVNHRTQRVGVEEDDNVKEIPVDIFENRSSTPAPPPLTLQSPPPPQPANVESGNRQRKSEKMKSSVKKEIAMVWASVLPNQKRKKKQRIRAVDDHNSHNALHISSELPNNTRASPPPPPPPPARSVFRSLFKKGLCKGNKVHSVSVPTPLRRKTLTTTKVIDFNDDEAVNAGNQLPLIPVAPPPPPPLKLPEMEVVARGEDIDVDIRAATFIARLKDEWRLEKLRSMKEKANFRPGTRPISIEGATTCRRLKI